MRKKWDKIVSGKDYNILPDFRYSLHQCADSNKYILIWLILAWVIHPNAILQQLKRHEEMLDFLVSHLEYMYEGFWISTTACLIMKERNYVMCIKNSQSSDFPVYPQQTA